VCVVYSSSRDLDVLPADANKGNALRWLAARLEIDTKDIVVAGDSGNDTSMFFVPQVNGIVVGNGRSELLEAVAGQNVYHARAHSADGVVEGLRHFGLGM
jgi:hydroxymethylpyrimidine pyrophosphatase-like HAD family hydrolase